MISSLAPKCMLLASSFSFSNICTMAEYRIVGFSILRNHSMASKLEGLNVLAFLTIKEGIHSNVGLHDEQFLRSDGSKCFIGSG